jgi:hypothetical protein
MRFIATIAAIATVAFSVAAHEHVESDSYIANMLGQKADKVKKPNKMPWSESTVSSLITEAWGIPYLTAQLIPGSTSKYWIGYAHVGNDVKSTSIVTEEQALQILKKDLKTASQCV